MGAAGLWEGGGVCKRRRPDRPPLLMVVPAALTVHLAPLLRRAHARRRAAGLRGLRPRRIAAGHGQRG